MTGAGSCSNAASTHNLDVVERLPAVRRERRDRLRGIHYAAAAEADNEIAAFLAEQLDTVASSLNGGLAGDDEAGTGIRQWRAAAGNSKRSCPDLAGSSESTSRFRGRIRSGPQSRSRTALPALVRREQRWSTSPCCAARPSCRRPCRAILRSVEFPYAARLLRACGTPLRVRIATRHPPAGRHRSERSRLLHAVARILEVASRNGSMNSGFT